MTQRCWPRSVSAVTPGIARSRKSSSLVALLARVDAHRFGPDFARRGNALLERRNAECHSGAGAFANPQWQLA